MSRKFIILVDMDDTIENLLEAWVKFLNVKYDLCVGVKDITSWNLGDTYTTLTKEQIFEPLFNNDFWKTVTPKLDAMKYLKLLHDEGHDIYICTNSNHKTIDTKIEALLKPYFPFIDDNHIVTICNKSLLLHGDFMIDDNPKNLMGDYQGILYDMGHNKNFDCELYDIERVYNWEEIYTIISLCSIGSFDKHRYANILHKCRARCATKEG